MSSQVQVQVSPFTFDRVSGEVRTPFASVAAARRYLDRAGRMDARQMRAARIEVSTEASHGAYVVASFPRVDGRFRKL